SGIGFVSRRVNRSPGTHRAPNRAVGWPGRGGRSGRAPDRAALPRGSLPRESVGMSLHPAAGFPKSETDGGARWVDGAPSFTIVARAGSSHTIRGNRGEGRPPGAGTAPGGRA